MKMKLKDIQQRLQSLTQLKDKRLPFQMVRAIAKNIKLLQEETEILEKQRIEICKKYAELDENKNPIICGGAYTIKPEYTSVFNDEVLNLLEEEVDVELITISSEEIDRCNSDMYDPLTANDYLTLELMIS
ncbi:MAG: hypothetical protein PHE63_07455 [Eubacteriales bacterium]|nr:hypothetical protein [Eubacteriales bacterium]